MADALNQAVLLRDSSRPATSQLKPQRLWLPDAAQGIAENGFNQIEDANGNLPVRLNAVAQVTPKLRIKESLTITRQALSPGAAW